jgi:hypothetical protein
MQNATHSKLSLRLPIEAMVDIAERAQQNGSSLFSYVARKIESRHYLKRNGF